jgi:hypothetical protein
MALNVLFAILGIIFSITACYVWAMPISDNVTFVEEIVLKVGYPALALFVGLICIVKLRQALMLSI